MFLLCDSSWGSLVIVTSLYNFVTFYVLQKVTTKGLAKNQFGTNILNRDYSFLVTNGLGYEMCAIQVLFFVLFIRRSVLK